MIYSNENYREYLIETIETLNQAQQDLFTMGVNLLMNGELQGINDSFEAGDVFEFFPEHLDNTDDQNLHIIMKCSSIVKNHEQNSENQPNSRR